MAQGPAEFLYGKQGDVPFHPSDSEKSVMKPQTAVRQTLSLSAIHGSL